MPVSNCKRCGRIYNRVRRDICPACLQEEEQAFQLVRNYLKEHRDASMSEVSESTGVEIEIITGLIRDGRLILRDNPNMSYACERCGQPTQAGRYCATCTRELSTGLSAAGADLRKKAKENETKHGYYSR